MQRHPDLNDSQWQAVQYDGGHLLIVAGPGTGKTHTLTHRMARLSQHKKVLAITFTNKAAHQMQERLGQRGVSLDSFFVGTFHRFCLHLLRTHIAFTALPKSFRVAVPDDIESMAKEIWPSKSSSQRKEALEQISLLKSAHLVVDPTIEFKEYQRHLRANDMIDFDDILREALVLLDTNEDILRLVQEEFPYICVDEYQDINLIQNAFLKILCGSKGTLTAIGDPHQSIYGFRGSEVRLFNHFTQDFAGGVQMYLTENYRSCANLLTASAQVIAKGTPDNDFELIAKIYEEGRLVIHPASTDRAEADYIASQIEKMIGGMDMLSAIGAHRSFGDFAILYRLNSQRHAIVQALEHLGIPYQVSVKPVKNDDSDESALGHYEETVEYNVEKVSLMTLHAAKGLEFPVVFMAGCEEHLLPLDLEGMKGDSAEERRLFYVGMTRAKECLFLTHANRRQLFGKTVHFDPSPFLSDIDEKLKAYEAARRQKMKKVEAVDDSQMKLF